ncbi:hypothetical protein MVES_000684 [Malassezia vespertilionis]|uniref:Uncharacterized protein n=1 Tax=Malassezia vespertilionis TaxID=2020962 RepID=A0A2N1JFV9_9BASI|nr:hypothetical protein MVES_000684 [Malassezia vespertilionis]
MRDAFYTQLLASSPTQVGFNESNQETINSDGLSSTPDEGFDIVDDDRRNTHNDSVTDVGEIDDAHNCVTESTSTSDTDDSDMAKQIDAAGEGESLLGSDSSDDDERLAKEEEYLIQEVIQGSHNRGACFDNSAGKVFDINNEDNPREHNEFWNSLSPNVRTQENGVLGEEMFKPQRGFASSPEPSFSDFFVSSDEMDAQQTEDDCDDDEMLTTDEDSMSGSESDSSISNASLSTPLLAHYGAAQTDSDQNDTLYDGEELDEDGSLKSAIPLLVIEDLDGRLIYARAGDGEAVFGSDGEFEFAEESEDESSSDEFSDFAQTHSYKAENKTGTDTTLSNTEHSGVDTLDGDTTDELPDEDMPYPRLLVGSVAPKGGKNARRAREIAARCRLLSPRPSSVLTSAGRSTFSRVPSALSMISKVADDQTDASSESPEPVGNAKEAATGAKLFRDAKTREGNFVKPEMGEFMPAMSKSVRRAVIDGSHRAPSPFIDRNRLQHALGRKRQGKGDAEDSLEHALQGSRRLKRKRAPTQNSFHALTNRGPLADLTSQNMSSNPESMDQGSMMDLCDVLDENLLWQEVDSQEPPCDNDDHGELVSRDTHANAKQRGDGILTFIFA